MHTAKCWFLNLVILCFSFQLINASTLVINKENGQKPTVIFTPCKGDSDCAGFGAENFTCLNQYCKCDGTKFCVHPNKAGLNKLEESCSTNSDCIIEYSVCEKGKCQCEKDKAASLDKRSCLTNTTKDTCTNCSKTENTCSEGQCSCENGFVPNSDSTQCLKVAVVIDDFCEEDIQCSETFVNAVCINTSCQCPASYKFNSTVQTCVKKAALGGQCERDEECEQSSNATVSNRVSCLSGRCECKSQFVEKEGQCTSLLEPCIEPLCSEFSEKMRLNQTCVPGRCECPEERQFCTNTDSTWVNNLKKGNRRQAMTNNDVNEEVQKILSDWEPLIREGSLATIYTLVICTILVMTHGAPEVLQQYSLYIFAFNVYLIIMCSLVVLGYYDRVGDITIYLLVPCIFFGTVYCIIIVCNGYVIPYILNRFFPDDDTPQDNVEVQQDEAQVQPDEAQSDVSEVQNEVKEVHNESPNISASSTQSLHSRGRGRKKGGKKRRR